MAVVCCRLAAKWWRLCAVYLDTHTSVTRPGVQFINKENNTTAQDCSNPDCVMLWVTAIVQFSSALYRVIRNECRGFNNLSYTIHLRQEYMYFFLFNRTTLQFSLHTLQVLYMYTLCDSTDINTIIEFVPNCL